MSLVALVVLEDLFAGRRSRWWSELDGSRVVGLEVSDFGRVLFNAESSASLADDSLDRIKFSVLLGAERRVSVPASSPHHLVAAVVLCDPKCLYVSVAFEFAAEKVDYRRLVRSGSGFCDLNAAVRAEKCSLIGFCVFIVRYLDRISLVLVLVDE